MNCKACKKLSQASRNSLVSTTTFHNNPENLYEFQCKSEILNSCRGIKYLFNLYVCPKHLKSWQNNSGFLDKMRMQYEHHKYTIKCPTN